MKNNIINQWQIQDFPEGSAYSGEGERLPMIWHNFFGKLHEHEKNWPGWERPRRPLTSATVKSYNSISPISFSDHCDSIENCSDGSDEKDCGK